MTSAEPVESPPGEPTDRPGLDRGLLLIAGVVVVGTIMSILDATVVNVAINKLAVEFETSLTTIQWVVTGYTLALATVIPLTAWSTTKFGTKRIYMVSIVLFAVGSLLAGMAWDSFSLIVFRVLQGLGGGMLMPVGMIILTQAAGPSRIGRVMAVIGIPTLLGPIAGPILGGWLVDSFSWRWIFFINLPIAVVAFWLAARILTRDNPGEAPRLDYLGVALLSPGLALLLYGLAEFGARGDVAHVGVIAPIVAGILLLAGFLWHALRSAHPLIDLRLYANKVFAGASMSLLLVVLAVFGGMLLIPLYLQFVRGEDALGSGLLMAPQGIGAVIAMPIGGILADRIGVGKIVPGGLALIAAAFAWLTTISHTTSYGTLSIALFGLGLGMGFTLMPTITGTLQTLPRRSLPNANTSLSITQQVGTSIGTSVLAVILANAMSTKLAALAPQTGTAGGSSDLSTLQQVPEEVFAQIQPVLADSFGTAFTWALGFVLISLVVAAVLLPQRRPTAAGGTDSAEEPPPML